MIKRTGWIILLLLGCLLAPRPSVGQDIFVEPDGDFEQKTLAGSDGGAKVAMMVSQPFQF